MPVITRIASEIADAARAAAVRAIGTPWTRTLTLERGLFDREAAEDFRIGLLPLRSAVPNELVVIDFNLDEGIPAPLGLAELVCKELCPFIIGVGEVRAEITPKGIVLLTADDGEREDRHSVPPSAEATIDAPLPAVSPEPSLPRTGSEG